MSQLKEKILRFLRENPIFSRFLKNSGYMFSSSTISVGLVAVQAVLAARLLGKDALGLITLVMAITTTVNQLFSFRMGEYVIRFYGKAKSENNQDQIFSVIRTSAMIESITSICAFLFLFFMAPLLAKTFIKSFPMDLSIQLLHFFGVTILFNLVTETSNGILRITNRFKTQAFLQLIQAIVTFTIITLAFLLDWGFKEVLLAYFVGKIVIGSGPIILAFQAMNKDYGHNWFFARSQSRAPLKETLHFAVSTNLSATVKMVASESWPLWLGVFLDAGSVGLFKVAMSIVNLLTIPITPLISTAFPDITRSVVAKKWQELRKLLKQITLLATAWTVPAAIFMILFGKWLVWIFGKDFPESYHTLLFLLLGYAVTNIFFWNRTLLLSFGKANIPLYILAAGAVVKIGLAFVVIPRFGVNGEAALISGYFTLTTLVMIGVGYNKIRTAELVEPASEAS